jgi:hypothetical protein
MNAAETIAANDYAFTCEAQQWSNDSYYVASSSPVHKLTVVASTKSEAVSEVKRVVGDAERGRHWKVWVREAVDVRLAKAGQS